MPLLISVVQLLIFFTVLAAITGTLLFMVRGVVAIAEGSEDSQCEKVVQDLQAVPVLLFALQAVQLPRISGAWRGHLTGPSDWALALQDSFHQACFNIPKSSSSW